MIITFTFLVVLLTAMISNFIFSAACKTRWCFKLSLGIEHIFSILWVMGCDWKLWRNNWLMVFNFFQLFWGYVKVLTKILLRNQNLEVMLIFWWTWIDFLRLCLDADKNILQKNNFEVTLKLFMDTFAMTRLSDSPIIKLNIIITPFSSHEEDSKEMKNSLFRFRLERNLQVNRDLRKEIRSKWSCTWGRVKETKVLNENFIL